MIRKLILLVSVLLGIDSICEGSLLQAMELQQGEVTNESLKKLYEWESPWLLYIPQEQLSESFDDKNLQKLFETHNCIPDSNMILMYEPESWNNKDWHKAVRVLKNGPEVQSKIAAGQADIPELIQRGLIHEYVDKKVVFDDVPLLLESAKIVLKSFIAADDVEFMSSNFIEKGRALNRLFTYTELQRVIKQQGLSHNRLPRKFLFVKNKTTDKLIKGNQARAIIDEIIKVAVIASKVKAKIHCYSPDYRLVVLAERQVNHGKPFSAKHMVILEHLLLKLLLMLGMIIFLAMNMAMLSLLILRMKVILLKRHWPNLKDINTNKVHIINVCFCVYCCPNVFKHCFMILNITIKFSATSDTKFSATFTFTLRV